MCLEKYSPLTRAILGGLLGVIVGIIGGIAFSSLIVLLVNLLHNCMPTIGGGNGFPCEMPPYAMAQFFGGGAGAIIGSIIGAVYSNKK